MASFGSSVIKERVENLENCVNTILDEDKLFFEEFDVTISCICRELRNLQLVAGCAFALSVLATILACFL